MVSDDLATIFSDVAQQLEPDLAAIIGEATRRGRRLKARRRIAIALSAGATVLAIAAGTTLGAQLAGGSAQGLSSAGPGQHRTAKLKPKLEPTPKTGPKTHHPAAVPQEHGPGMTPGRMLSVLRTLLPAGDITDVIPYLSRGGVEVNFDAADGKGAVDVNVGVYPTLFEETADGSKQPTDVPSPNQARDRDELYCPDPPLKDEGQRPAGAPPISCTRTVLGDGEVVLREITEADEAGYYDLAVYVARPDGVTVSIDVGNGTLEGTPHEGRQGWPWVDRAVPPGSFKVWERVARSPKWHL